LVIGFSQAASGDGGGESAWDWDVDWICARLAARGVCAGHPLVVKRDLDLRWYGLLWEAWQQDPLARDWAAAEHKFKPPQRKTGSVSVEALPSYQQLLAEFERRTARVPRPAAALPAPAAVFAEFERRTGQKALTDG
jgi:hypothetical protein